jgi:two-component system CheB/CheR fusion protein
VDSRLYKVFPSLSPPLSGGCRYFWSSRERWKGPLMGNAAPESWEGELFRLLDENVRDYAIFLMDTQRRVIGWSRGAERLLGYTEQEVVGQSADRFCTPEDLQHDMPQQELIRAQTIGRQEADRWHVRKDGSRFWSCDVTTPLWTNGGQLRGFATILQDRTALKEAEQARQGSEQRFARFMQCLPGLAWIKDAQGRYVYVNDAAEKAFQVSRARLYGKSDADIFDADTAAQFHANDQRALVGGSGVLVIEKFKHADGIEHFSVVSKFLIPGAEGTPALIGGMAIDITEQKRIEEELQEANRNKDEFLAMLAHELRNPLAPIRNALHIMKQPGVSALVIERSREMAERQVQHMARLLDDLLDVSRISRGRIELRHEPVDIVGLMSRTVEVVRPLIEGCRHELLVSFPPSPLRVEGDSMRLEQVLTNLLNNAAKYTEPGGRIGLSAAQEKDEVVLRVHDTGIGIAEEMLPKIFDLFVRADNRLDRSQGGVGIGLTLVKRLVELHGGTVEAHSAGLGRGSEFLVRLPAWSEARPGETIAPSSGAASALPPTRVLVVDDNRDAADSLAEWLRMAGHDVRVAYNGPTALVQAEDLRPALVLLDIGMPGLDGYEVARRLRRMPGGQAMRLVALTGWGQEEDRRRSREAGFDHHLIKPVEPAAVQQFLLPNR